MNIKTSIYDDVMGYLKPYDCNNTGISKTCEGAIPVKWLNEMTKLINCPRDKEVKQ